MTMTGDVARGLSAKTETRSTDALCKEKGATEYYGDLVK
jgi:hypothetical protein